MTELKSPSICIIHDASAADVLLNPQRLRLLEPFIGRECSVTQAARETQSKANTLLTQVRRFCRLGLLVISREVPRKGRAIKLYRSSADIFFVPYEASSAESLDGMMQERDSYWESQLRHGVVNARIEDVGTWGTRIYKDQRGRLQIQTAISPERNYTMLDPDRPAVLSAWRDNITLDFADAKALQMELYTLLQRYQQKQGAQRYILRLGLAPITG